jgi:uncharacterized membrane protein YjfL (UPF0719 family)
VDVAIIGGNLLYAVAGMLLMFGGFLLFDRLTPRMDFSDELRKGNLAVAVVVAALFLSVAYIIGRSLN